jgi:hypothetical protein
MTKIVSKSYKTAVMLLLCLFAAGVVFQSCKEDETFRIDAYGPSKIERCGEIYFIGKKLDEVEKIYLPADDYDEKWAIDKSNFVSKSSDKITLNIPCDYPFDQTGPVKVIYSKGKEYFTTTRFMVLSEIAVLGVVVDNKLYEGDELDPGTEITVLGASLMLVDSVVFDNGVGVSRSEFILHEEYGDVNKYITFKLPATVPTGSIFSLKVPARKEGADDLYKEVCEVFVIGPSVKGLAPNNGVNVHLCSSMEIFVNRVDRLDVDENGYTQLTIGTVAAEGKVEGEKITLEVPAGLSFYAPEPYSIILKSIGKSYASKTDLTVAKPVFRYELVYVNGVNYRIKVFGNLCSLKNVRYTLTTGVQSYGTNPTAIVENGDKGWQFGLSRLDTGSGKMTLVFESGDELDFDFIP